MSGNLSVSVAMATFNGEKYVSEQIESILVQLGVGDELIIADDGSTDHTLEIVMGFADEDERVRVLQNSGLGIASNFERAIRACGNDLIFLSDQDDVWLPAKVEVIRGCFLEDPEVTLIMSDSRVVDENLEPIYDSYIAWRGCGRGVLRNLFKNGYLGCSMAYRREFNSVVLPIPSRIPMNHDAWIGILAEMFGRVKVIDEKLVLYRRHEKNSTSLYSVTPLRKRLVWRFKLAYFLLIRTILVLTMIHSTQLKKF